jgi:hypothetical protein
MLSWETSKFPPCMLISNKAGAENQTSDQACATMHEAVFRFLGILWENASHDNITAFSTVAIAVFTFVLYRATNKMWDAGERQLLHLEDTAERQLRAYVFTAGGVISLMTTEDRRNYLEISIGIKNFGQTPAYHFSSWSRADIFDANYPIFEIAKSDEMSIVGPAASRDAVIVKGPITDSDLSAIRDGSKRIFVWGRIDYIDAFGRPRHFQFYDHNGREILAPGKGRTGRWPIHPWKRSYQAN